MTSGCMQWKGWPLDGRVSTQKHFGGGREKKNRCGLGLDKENKDLHLSRRRLYEETHRFSCSCDRIVSGAVFFLSHLICAELICP